MRLAGTTAFFTVFAMAPIIIIIVSVVGILLGQEQIQEKVFTEVNKLIGEKGSQYMRNLVANYHDANRGVTGTIIGFIIFIFTSTTFFTVLQKSINSIWRIRAKPTRGILKSLKDRLRSFGLILILGFVMLVSLIIDAAISFSREFINDILPNLTFLLIKIGNFIVSFGIVMIIFAMIYKFLPDAKIKWNVTWAGSFITTVLFVIGKFIIGLILGYINISVMYGAAGSFVVILLWVFYSSIIFFYGAEITQQYAALYAKKIEPKDYAVKIEIKEVE